MADFKKEKSPTQGKGEAEVDWITVNGAHIPIRDEENIEDAVDNFSAKNLIKHAKSDTILLPKQEYAELCSAIRTKHADKIPATGTMLYGNNYYKFTYSKVEEKILCKFKIQIAGNEEIISRLEVEYDNEN